MSARARVVITDSNLGREAEERLRSAAGIEVVRLQCTTEDELVAALGRAGGADVLMVQWAPVSAAVLDAAPMCRFISRLGIGYDMIDVATATKRGIAVANTPDYCVDEVVAHTLAMSLWLLRGLGPLDASLRRGEWDAVTAFSSARRPSLTTIGVVGVGRIGARVASQAQSLGYDVIAYDPYATVARPVRPTTFDALLQTAHLVTLHTPLTDETRGLIGRDALARMRKGALLINTCRGGLIDEGALVESLRTGHLGGAGLDVFEHEPLPASDPLRNLPNVLLTPHAAWYSQTSLAELPVQAAQQVVDFLAGRPVASIVNPDYAAQSS